MPILASNESKYSLTFEGATPEQMKRYDELVHILFRAGVFELKNGTASLSFDHMGNLQQVKIDFIRWRRDKIG